MFFVTICHETFLFILFLKEYEKRWITKKLKLLNALSYCDVKIWPLEGDFPSLFRKLVATCILGQLNAWKLVPGFFLGLGIHSWSQKYPKMSPSGCKFILKKTFMYTLWPQIWGCWRTAAKNFFVHTVVCSIYFAKMIVFFIYSKNIKVSVKSWNAKKTTFHNTCIYCLTADLPITSDSKLTLWEPAYDIFVLRFRPKKQQFLVALATL